MDDLPWASLDEPDIQTGLPAEVSGGGYSRKPIPAFARGDEAVWRPFRDDVWDEEVAGRFDRVVAFRAFRSVMESQAQDAYREGPFDRVWCGFDRGGEQFTKFGLQFAGRTITGSLHHDADPWAEAVELALDKLATELFPDPEPPFLPGGEQTPEARRAAVAGAFPQFRK